MAINTKGGTLLGSLKKYGYILVFLVIYLVYASASGGLSIASSMNILRHSAVIGCVAIGMGLICLTGDIDLSVGSMLALVAGFAVVAFNATGSIIVTLLFALVFGALLGFINGVLVGVVKMPAFIATLATMLIYRSLSQYFCQHLPAELIGNGSSVYRMSASIPSYQGLYGFGNGKLGVIPIVGIVLIALAVALVYVSGFTKFGKKIYAVGSNAKAAQLAGINVALIRTLVFTLSGVLVGLGAFLWIAMNASADPATTGSGYEMYAIASVVLGGVSMAGGRGTFLGVLFGTLSYDVIDKIIIALKMDSLINNSIKGVILILVILIQISAPEIRAWFVSRRKSA